MCSQFPLILSALLNSAPQLTVCSLWPFTLIITCYFLLQLFTFSSFLCEILQTQKLTPIYPSHFACEESSYLLQRPCSKYMYLSMPGKGDVIRVHPKNVLPCTHTWLHTDNLATHTDTHTAT